VKKPIVFCLLLLTALTGLRADVFAFKFTKGDRYRVVTTVSEDVLVDGRLSHSAEFLNKIALTVTDVANGTGAFSALFEVSERQDTAYGSFLLSEEMSSTYSVDPRGRSDVAPALLYPLTRDIPCFPAQDLKPGDGWSAPGWEIHDLRRPYGINEPFRIPVTVQYTFLGVKKANGRDVAEFDVQYTYMAKVKPAKSPAGPYYPVTISGMIKKDLLWDASLGRMDSYTEDFDVFYYLSNGAVVEFVGKHTGRAYPAEAFDKEKAVQDINREIEKNKLEGVRVEATDRGVKITLENVQFQPDSDAITPQEARKIETIAGILKKYPGRDIKLVGHTAAVGTPESCLELSIRRATAVGDALLKLGARRADQMTIQGKGLTEPIAPNNTEAGRIKNRRVEIFILEN
jgi:outer membrane protein OmpA-like peptidoglycan-associated protein